MGTLTSSNVLTQVSQQPFNEQYIGPPTVHGTYSSHSNAIPYFKSGNSFCNTNQTTMSRQEGNQPQNTQANRINELSPYDSTEIITVSHFVSSFSPEDGH